MSWNIGLKDKIGSLSHNAGVISLQPSILTIGGKQYKTNTLTRIISSDVTLVANTLYMIYAHVIGGVVQLRVSSLNRSAYKAINPSSELIGAFYADGLLSVGFGAFINIYGRPESEWVQHIPTGTWTTNTTYAGRWRRIGQSMDWQPRVLLSGAPNAGSLVMNIPANHTIDTLVNQISNNLGFGYLQDTGTTNYPVAVLIVSPTTMAPVCLNSAGTFLLNNNISALVPFTFANTDILDFMASITIAGWSNTALMDL